MATGSAWPAPHAIDSADKFDAAIASMRKRAPVGKDEWNTMSAFERENAFTVAKVTNGRVLQDVMDAIDSAVTAGEDLEDFKERIELQLVESWGGEIPGRIETIFRTNLATSYSEGRHAIYSSPTVKQARPYLRFDSAEDDRECEICEPFDGVIRPQDEWAKTTVPLHYNCRCTLVPLSEEEAQDEGIDDALPDVQPDEDFGDAPHKHGDNWDFDLSSMDPALRTQVELAIEDGED